MEEIDDRRGSGRVQLMEEVSLQYGETHITATALDLGVGGVAVWGPEKAPAGPIHIGLGLGPGDRLKLTGEVVRQFHSDGGAVWGIAFRDIEPSAARRLEAFVLAHCL